MDKLEKNLDIIQQEYVDPTVVVGAIGIIGTGMVVSHLISMFIGVTTLTRQFKVDPVLSKRINGILNSGDKWIVHIFPAKGPNAFSLGFGRHIFVTSALLKLLNERHVDAILLHEVYHSANKHTPKKLMMQYPLYYLATAVAVGAAVTIPMPFSGLLAFWLVNNIGNILYNITMGRRHEVKADDFAVQNGYGKELIEAFKLIEDWVSKRVNKTHCGRWCQIMNKIDDAIDEHPSFEQRIKNILEAMDKMKAYKASFAKIKNTVTRMWKNNG
jgi:Zn-dependent protease with chaperone function